MRIGGLVKQSLIDYPGKIAAVVFTRGCNFRCGYCHNPELVLPQLFNDNQLISKDELFAFLQKRRKWIDAVVVTGGEPTIQNNLPAFLNEIKSMGYLLKLDTNGSNPNMLRQIISERLVDYYAMDIKTIVDEVEYSRVIGILGIDKIIENIKESVSILKSSTVKCEFRTTFIPGIHNEKILELTRKFVGYNRQLIVNEFRGGNSIENYSF